MPRLSPAPVVFATLLVIAAVGLFREHRLRRTAERDLAQSRAAHEKTAADTATLNERIVALQTQVSALDASLGDTKTKLTVTEVRKVQLTRELAEARTEIAAHAQHVQTVTTEAATLREQLASAHSAETSSASVAAYRATIAELEQKLAQSGAVPAADPPPAAVTAVLTTDRTRSTQVVSVGPSSAFVVLDYGAAHGALPGQALSIQRGTDVLAVVHISDVHPRHSLAHVQPGTLRAALHKGDSAVLNL
jgi:hypothetical protein